MLLALPLHSVFMLFKQGDASRSCSSIELYEWVECKKLQESDRAKELPRRSQSLAVQQYSTPGKSVKR